MYLYFDTVSETFSLKKGEEVEFLGPFAHTLLKLQQYGYTESQAREAVLNARFNRGLGVDMDWVVRVA